MKVGASVWRFKEVHCLKGSGGKSNYPKAQQTLNRKRASILPDGEKAGKRFIVATVLIRVCFGYGPVFARSIPVLPLLWQVSQPSDLPMDFFFSFFCYIETVKGVN